MALNKDVLGQALYDVRASFSNKTLSELGGDLEAAKLSLAKAEADAIIAHFKANALLNVPGTGLVAPPSGGPVTGASVTGTIS
jgi:hypothetical protein